MTWNLYEGARFPEIAAEWDGIAEGPSVPFLESRFVREAMREFGTGSEWVAVRRRDGKADAALIVQKARLGMWQTFQPSQLPLGPVVVACGTDIVDALRTLLPALPGMAVGIGVTQLDPTLIPRPADTGVARTIDYIDTAWVDLEGDFEQYWEARGKNLKQNMRKQRNKLQADGVEAVLELVDGVDGFDAAIRQFGELESAGWKGEAGTAVTPDGAQGRFYAAMLAEFRASGNAFVYQYRFAERIVAMDLCISAGATLVILKTAYDGSYKTLSPAFLMRQDQFRELYAHPTIRRIEFYGRVMEWHTRWTDKVRALYHLNVYRNPLIASLQDRRKANPAAEASDTAETS